MADTFTYQGDVLVCEGVPLPDIANQFGTPAYVYSSRAILDRFREYENALAGFPHKVCFAVKANSNLAVLRTLADAGSGFDIVSGGELYRVLAAGGDPASVVFSGVGKTYADITFAIGQGIHSFNCESEMEVEIISQAAVSLDRVASVAMRVNPDVNAETHPYISTGLREHKFGIDIATAEAVYRRIANLPGVRADGVSCHIGSQILDVDPLLEAAEKMIALAGRLKGHGFPIRYLDLGGGLGVPYRIGDDALSIDSFIGQLRVKLSGLDLSLMLEPGRSIVAEAGILLTRVLFVKKNGEKTFVIVDAGMNDLIRPALYQAHHEIRPVQRSEGVEQITADIVGPVCETGDFFARGRDIQALHSGDLIAILTAGAYGFVLASNYNSRPRPCEVLVDGTDRRVVRQRETYEDLIRSENAG